MSNASEQTQSATTTTTLVAPDMDRASVLSAYRRYAGSYDMVFGPVLRPGLARAIERVNRTGGRRVLEIGVGTGLALPRHRRDNSVVGIDISPDMLAVARRRVVRQELAHVETLLEMDARDLDFPDASFDAVVAAYVMSVVPGPERVMLEMQRVCKPGGEMVIVNHFASEVPGLRREVERALARFAPRLGWRPDFPLATVLAAAGQVTVTAIRAVPPFGLFSLIECRKAVPG